MYVSPKLSGQNICCPLVSHIEYAPRTRKKDQTERQTQTDGCQTVTFR